VPIDRAHWEENLLSIDSPDFDVDAYVSNAPPAATFDLREKLEQWRKDGIVVFEAAVDGNLIDLLLEDIRYLDAHPKDFDLEIEYKGNRMPLRDMQVSPLSDTGIKFNCLENLSLAARCLSLTPSVCEFLTHVFQDAPSVLQTLTFWRGSEQPAHLDWPYVRTQTRLPHLAASWIPLEDVHPDSGPLCYYPGSHQQGVIDLFDWGRGSIVYESDSSASTQEFSDYLYKKIDELGLKREVFLPKRGDVLIWHGNVLHEGTGVTDRSRTRRSFVTHYTSLEAYPQDHMLPDALRTGAYTSLNGGYVFDHPWVNDERQLPSWQALSA
jgi:phytanoyl-CoA hydroxylase